jgi:hypothetical protein
MSPSISQYGRKPKTSLPGVGGSGAKDEADEADGLGVELVAGVSEGSTGVEPQAVTAATRRKAKASAAGRRGVTGQA